MRPVSHHDELPEPKTVENFTSGDAAVEMQIDENESSSTSSEKNYVSDMNEEPHLITPEELNHLVRDLNSSKKKNHSDLLGSRLQGAFGFSLCMAGILLAGCDAVINILCFALSLFSLGIAVSGVLISGVDMAPTFAGSLMGVASTVAAIGSYLVPVITGLLTTHVSATRNPDAYYE
ncbi:hypothetical protein AVEN_217795-1 [Araneus ventricosus]|uniref:Uncharacterized protein n=1 Tax=Araneus ventricosus TaxID=182803 RepID=A0A4Y2T0A2_ARAVE|nr:hypothetical protein AVEN_217795-1 [Araneus ventricosus]